MKYSTDAKVGARILESTPAALAFPGQLEKLPTGAGVILLSNDIDDVVYVVWGSSIRPCAEKAAHNAAAANKLRWFRTADQAGAKVVGKVMIRRFKPEANSDDSQSGVAPV